MTHPPQKMFVTGGAGFIGTHLVLRLLELGHSVTVFDKRPPNRVLGERLAMQNNKGNEFRYFTADILSLELLENAMADHDVVFHLAANTDIPTGIENTRLDLDNCTIGTWNVLEAMRRLGLKDLVFSSTAAVYGNQGAVLPITENTTPAPISLYGAGKLACEAFIAGFANLFDMRATIFRFGNVIGGYMDHGVIFDTIRKVRNAQATDAPLFRVWGNGLGRKPFFLVDDCVEGMIVMAGIRQQERHMANCEIFNLGTDTTTEIRAVINVVQTEMDSKLLEVYEDSDTGFQGDVPIVQLSAARMAAFGWRASVTSNEAVVAATKRLLRGEL